MPAFIAGLPLHVLLIHIVVVLVPLASLGGIVIAVWPAARRRFGWLVVAAAAISALCIPITTNAGEELKHRLPPNPLIQAHAHLGDQLLIYVIGLFVVSAILVAFDHAAIRERIRIKATPTRIVAGVLVVVMAAVCAVQVVRIGDSGARAAWSQRQYLPAQQNSH